MNFKKNFKRFFTLSRSAEGFTLVELIVVIAILAILGGVAVPAYSGYVTRANKGADVTLIGEVQHALALYYYSNPDADMRTAWVKLDQEGNPQTAGETGAKAMVAVFGEGWEDAVGLKYADWKGDSSSLSYGDSSYYGHESELIGKVDGLTSALGEVIEKDKNMGDTLINSGFKQFLSDNKVDNNGKAIGNAAVLYVAQNMQGKSDAIQTAFNNGITNPDSVTTSAMIDNIFTELYRTGIGSAASVAAIYAYAEGYAQATGQADKFNPNFSNVGSTDSSKAAEDAVDALISSLESLQITGIEGKEVGSFADYISKTDENGKTQSQKDLQGYIDMMGTVHENQNIISGNLNASDCFTDGAVENMLKGHAAMSSMDVTTGDGQVAVGLAVDANGTVLTPVTPLNWNK